ncbi:MAG TPA: O-acetylhomoserine aminocarboxypropyltransferase/cysteine synthase [Firmicutes bacterium]|nr:O-acetylhomoserine aminocarboxypropyltransferase/cysteine synthase [Bacillota bacterium]
MKIETKVLHKGYEPRNGEPRTLPIYQSTTYQYDSAEEIGQLFDLSTDGFFYSRIHNPTVDAVEKKIASLEGGIGALCTTSGQAASFLALMNILKAGDHFISSSTIYGGSVNLFAVTMRRFGIDCTFVDAEASEVEIQKAIQPNTKAIFGETIANPALTILDIEKFACIAKKNKIPLIIDNTFATPVLCRPIEFGANIVIHSTTKYMDGHAVQLGGVIVDGGNFNWTNGKFPEFTEPDASYHGIVYTDTFKEAAYIVKARVQLMRDLGCYPTAQDAFLLNLGLETLPIRMKQHCENALAIARFLSESDMVESVNYPGLENNPYHTLMKKYTPNGCSGVVSFIIKGGRENAMRFMNALKLAGNVVHVADIRTCILHPASSTHRQLTDEQLKGAGISPGLIRLSVGLENLTDILDDLKNGLSEIEK